MNEPIFILRGDICYSRNLTELAVMKQGYVICKEGVSLGVCQELPGEYQNLPIRDCGEAVSYTHLDVYKRQAMEST